MRKSTVAPTQVSTVRETITLETPKATVTNISFAEGRRAARERNKNREWLDIATRSVAAYEVLS